MNKIQVFNGVIYIFFNLDSLKLTKQNKNDIEKIRGLQTSFRKNKQQQNQQHRRTSSLKDLSTFNQNLSFQNSIKNSKIALKDSKLSLDEFFWIDKQTTYYKPSLTEILDLDINQIEKIKNKSNKESSNSSSFDSSYEKVNSENNLNPENNLNLENNLKKSSNISIFSLFNEEDFVLKNVILTSKKDSNCDDFLNNCQKIKYSNKINKKLNSDKLKSQNKESKNDENSIKIVKKMDFREINKENLNNNIEIKETAIKNQNIPKNASKNSNELNDSIIFDKNVFNSSQITKIDPQNSITIDFQKKEDNPERIDFLKKDSETIELQNKKITIISENDNEINLKDYGFNAAEVFYLQSKLSEEETSELFLNPTIESTNNSNNKIEEFNTEWKEEENKSETNELFKIQNNLNNLIRFNDFVKSSSFADFNKKQSKKLSITTRFDLSTRKNTFLSTFQAVDMHKSTSTTSLLLFGTQQKLEEEHLPMKSKAIKKNEEEKILSEIKKKKKKNEKYTLKNAI